MSFSDFLPYARYALPILAVLILSLCLVPLLSRKPQSLGNVMIYDPHTGEVYPITARETSIGSHKDCDISLDLPSVQRQHAVIICGKDGWYIKGLNKDSPVFVNGAQAEKSQMISTGDKITIGNAVLVFSNKERLAKIINKSGGAAGGKQKEKK